MDVILASSFLIGWVVECFMDGGNPFLNWNADDKVVVVGGVDAADFSAIENISLVKRNSIEDFFSYEKD